MSTSTTTYVDTITNTTDVEVTFPESTTTLTQTNSREVAAEELDCIISGVKKEYCIVGDVYFAEGNTAEEAPTWLTDLVDNIVNNALSNGMIDYVQLIQDVRSAIDAIEIKANDYVEHVEFTDLVNGIMGTYLETINARFDVSDATIVNLMNVVATDEFALAQAITDLRAEYTDYVSSRITDISLAFANDLSAQAVDLTALTSTYVDIQTGLTGNADAISGLQTYVGLTTTNDPNGTGVLARLNILEKQTDGVIEFITDTYDVMIGVEDPNNDTSNDQLDTTKQPYASWKAADDAATAAAQAEAPEGVTWPQEEKTRAAHVGDVYIQYSDDENGTRTYIRSYKFIKTAVDETSPYSTDAEGYTWALVTDTDAQTAYVAALNAQDLADSKRRVFVEEPFGPYDRGDLWIDNSGESQVIKVCILPEGSPRGTGFLASEWELADSQAIDFISNVYNPEAATIRNQIDGQIEYYFFDSYNVNSSAWPGIDLSGAVDESDALNIISSDWNTEELRQFAHGNVIYFEDSKNAFWYNSTANIWQAITDTSMYQALEAASNAQATADGRVSQFFAWGGPEAPADYTLVYEDDSQELISASNFAYWLHPNGNLYYKPNTTWVLVPTTIGENVSLSLGDTASVFDPDTGDITVYTYNGSSWQQVGPLGIISKSRFFVDLNNNVTGPTGHVAVSLADLKIESEAYSDEAETRAKSAFFYDTQLIIDGVWYEAGFGLSTEGVIQTGDGTSSEAAFDSEFWINAERFVLKSPSYPGIQAAFQVTPAGITLGVEHTEATRNAPAGAHSPANAYDQGDIVTSSGQSYMAIQPVPINILISDTRYWQLLAERGLSGKSVDFWFKRSETVPTDTPATTGADANGWYTNLSNVPAGAGTLYTIKGTLPEGATSWVYDNPVVNNKKFVRELTIYSDVTTGSFTAPTNSRYNFATDTLSINDSNWNKTLPSLSANGQKIYAVTAIVSGNETETNVLISWSSPSIYAQRTDGTSTIVYQIGYPDGLALKDDGNQSVSLNVKKITDSGVSTITSGTVKLYDGTTDLGYSETFTRADVTGSKTIQLKDGSTVLDSVTIVDVIDGRAGSDAVYGVTEVPDGQVWTVDTNGVFTPTTGTAGQKTLHGVFYQNGSEIARQTLEIFVDHTERITYNTTTNDENISISLTAYDKKHRTITFTHTPSNSSVAESFYVVRDGVGGLSAYEIWLNEGNTGTLTDYLTSLIGADGADGSDGLPGQDGADGITLYTWIKYADNSTGTSGFSNNPANKPYIGISYNNISATESTNPADYSWSLIKGSDGYTPVKGVDYFDGINGTDGADGDTAYEIWLAEGNTGSTTDFINALRGADGADGSDGLPGTDGADGITYYTWIKYADSADGTVGFSNNPTGKPYIGFAFNKTTATESTNAADYTWSLIKGSDGTDGTDGENAVVGRITLPDGATFNVDAAGNYTPERDVGLRIQVDFYQGPNLLGSKEILVKATGTNKRMTWVATSASGEAITVSTPPYTDANITSRTFTFAHNNSGAKVTQNTSVIFAGGPGDPGPRGTASLAYSYSGSTVYNAVPSTTLNSWWAATAPAELNPPKAGDTFVITNTSTTSSGGMHIYEYTGTAWSGLSTFVVNGNQVINGTLAAEALVAGSITATQLTTASAVITSSAQISNAIITEAKIGDAQVSTLKIDNNAVTAVVTSFTAAATASTLLQTRSITTSASNAVLEVFGSAYIGTSATGGDGQYIYYNLYRDDVLLKTITFRVGTDRSVYDTHSIVFQDTPGAAGTYEYKLTRSGYAANVYDRYLSVREFKR